MGLDPVDRLALSDLVHLYAAGVDDRRFDDVVELFTDTAEFRLPSPPHQLTPARTERGHRGVRAAMAALGAVERTEHAIVGEVYAPGPQPGYALGRITCIAHHWSRRGTEIDDVVWHPRYDDEYLRTPAGWRIHGRALTINAIETRQARRLRDHHEHRDHQWPESTNPTAAVDLSESSTAPTARRTSPPGPAPGTR